MARAVAASPDVRAAQPEKTRLGTDVAGQVEAVGKNVTLFEAGDEVFGVARPSLRSMRVLASEHWFIKPANVTFEQAGSVAWAGFTALQGLRQGNIQPGQKVLINAQREAWALSLSR